MDVKKIVIVFGTRPEAIKMAPIIKEFKKYPKLFKISIIITAQHREMLDQVLQVFDIKPDFDLNIMKDNQSISYISSIILKRLDDVLKIISPDLVLVHGDTTTSFIASLVSFYNQIKIGHVEAGLRTNKKYYPFPEEMNRQLTDVLADVYFAPTSENMDNLLKEGKSNESIYVTGNTVIDALALTTAVENCNYGLISKDFKIILLTIHRKENLGENLKQVFSAIKQIVSTNEDIKVIYPVHPNPNIKDYAISFFKNVDRVELIEPLDVIEFHCLMKHSFLILSDSGGVQEEAPSLDVPVLVLRNFTERNEGLRHGVIKVIGTKEDVIINEVKTLIDNTELYHEMKMKNNPYGDGFASKRIVEAIKFEFGFTEQKPTPFLPSIEE